MALTNASWHMAYTYTQNKFKFKTTENDCTSLMINLLKELESRCTLLTPALGSLVSASV